MEAYTVTLQRTFYGGRQETENVIVRADTLKDAAHQAMTKTHPKAKPKWEDGLDLEDRDKEGYCLIASDAESNGYKITLIYSVETTRQKSRRHGRLRPARVP